MEINTELYQRQFYQEAKEILEEISANVLKVESDPDNRELLNAVFRGIHTIKGSAGVLEMDDISGFTHHIETLLNILRDGRITLTPDVVDTILAGVDHIIRMIEERASGKATSTDQALVERFVSYCSIETGRRPVSMEEKNNIPCNQAFSEAALSDSARNAVWEQLPHDVRNAFQEADLQGLNLFQVQLQYTSGHLENGYDPLVFLRNLRESCSFYHAFCKETLHSESGKETLHSESGKETLHSESGKETLHSGIPPLESGKETLHSGIPALEKLEPLKLYLHPSLFVTTTLSAEEIRNLTFDPSLIRIEEIHIPFDGKDAGDGEQLDPASLLEFIESATEILESLEKGVIDYERSGSRDSLNEIFRAVHNIKGDSDFIGLKNLAIFAHALESLLEDLRSGSISQTAELTDVILQSVDFLKQSIMKLAQNAKMPVLPPLYETLKTYVIAEEAKNWEKYLSPDTLPEMKEVFVEQIRQYKKILFDFTAPLPLDQKNHKIVERALNGVLKASELISTSLLSDYAKKAIDKLGSGLRPEPAEQLSETILELITFMEGIETEPKERRFSSFPNSGLGTKDDSPAHHNPVLPRTANTDKVKLFTPDKKSADRTSQPEPQWNEIRTMRIDERKVEDFTNMVGELLVARNTYEHLLNQIRGIEGISRKTTRRFKENLHLFSRLTNDIHHGVMSLRMVPVGRIFQKFNRVIRDISRKQKKQVELVIDGEDIEIDKKVADMLSDPLVHLIRNACDHGIEPPDERKAASKPENGMILLRASQEGSNLSIEIIDDGRGIDREKVCKKAKESGFEVDTLDSRSVLDLIFMPGLSTSAEVSDISGRGVGLDVVKTAVHSLGGSVQVTTEKNKGTEITLSIPMTMGIGTILLVESHNKSYAIPLSYIVETLKVPPEKIKRGGNKMFFYYRGDVLSVELLESLLNADVSTSGEDFRSHAGSWRQKEEISVIILKTIKGRHGIIVDRFDKNMELAIKPLPALLAGLNIASGVSIMGDGGVLLVLNPDKLLN